MVCNNNGNPFVLIDKRTSRNIIPYIFCMLYKRNETIWMICRNFVDEGNNPVNNPNILDIEETIDSRTVYNP